MEAREAIIRRYIDAYNRFDVKGMTENADETIVFSNVSNGVENMRVMGLAAFIEQAEKAALFFSSRTQTIRSIQHHNDETIVEIDYVALLATDLPNGLKQGDELNLRGKSIFGFSGDKIVALTDIG